MSTKHQTLITPQEYLALEREADGKSEYYKGEVFAFAGGSLRHNRITANLLASLHSQLRSGPCSAFSSDMRIAIPQTPHYAYADVVVVCGESELDDDFKDNLLNRLLSSKSCRPPLRAMIAARSLRATSASCR